MRPVRLALLLAVCTAPAGAVTLDDAIAAALAHDPSIAIADADRDAAGGRVTQARAGSLPSVKASGSIGVGQLDMLGFFGFGSNSVTPAALQASVEQPLFSGGRVTAEKDRARAGLAAAEAGRSNARGQLAAAVAAAYGEVLTTATMVESLRRLRD